MPGASGSQRETRLVGRFGSGGIELQLIPEMQADNGKKDQRAHIGDQPRQRGAAFVGKAGQCRMNGK